MAIVFAQQRREAIKTVFVRAIEARLVFVDAFVFAERRLKKAKKAAIFSGYTKP